MHLELAYTLTVDDVNEYQRSYRKVAKKLPRLRGARLPRAFVVWGAVLLGAIVMFVVFRPEPADAPAPAPAPPPHPANDVVLAFLPYILLAVVIWFFWRRRFSKKLARLAFKNSPALAEPQRVTLADDGLTMQALSSNSCMNWSHYLCFAETQNLFLLFSGRQTTDLFPKRAFPSPAALDEFRAFAQAHIGNTPIGFPVQPPKPPLQSKIEN